MRCIRSWLKSLIVSIVVEDYRANGRIRQLFGNRVIAGNSFAVQSLQIQRSSAIADLMRREGSGG